jgi:hypothetical protein
MQDIQNLMDDIDYLVLKDNYESMIKESCFKRFLSKLILLTYCIEKKHISTQTEWLVLQYDEKIQQILEKIYKLLDFDWSELLEIFRYYKKFLNFEIIIAIDEVNVLLEKHKDKFLDSKGTMNRSLSTKIVSTFSKSIVNVVPLIISGTHLKILDRSTLESSALDKPENSTFIQVNNFRCNNIEDATKFLLKFLKIDEKDESILEKYIDYFIGRSRIITSFIVFLNKSQDTLFEDIIKKWINEVTQENTLKSFYNLIDRFVQNNNDQWERRLAEIIYSFYLLEGKILIGNTDFMAAGFCFYIRNDNIFKIKEVY